MVTRLLRLIYLLSRRLGGWLRIFDNTLYLFGQALSINFGIHEDRKLFHVKVNLFQCIFQAELIIKFIPLSVNNLVEGYLYNLSTITMIR